MSVKVRVTKDCEHGAAGTILDVDDHKLEAFLAEGKVEVVEDEGAEPEPVVEETPAPVPAPRLAPEPARRKAAVKHKK